MDRLAAGSGDLQPADFSQRHLQLSRMDLENGRCWILRADFKRLFGGQVVRFVEHGLESSRFSCTRATDLQDLTFNRRQLRWRNLDIQQGRIQH